MSTRRPEGEAAEWRAAVGRATLTGQQLGEGQFVKKQGTALRGLLTLCGGMLCAVVLARAEDVVVIENAEMAGISGFRAFWDKPVVVKADGATRMEDKGTFGKGPVADWTTGKPGAPVFDAVHRSLLVRFPGAAEKIAAEVKNGKSVKKLELVLPFVDTELFPLGYAEPAGMSFLGDLWVKVKPEWHAVAWALRKPWAADPQGGPTFNAQVNGAAWWAKYGAQDEKSDRFPAPFGPAEVSHATPEGRMDVSALLSDNAFGKSLGERLRALSDCGFLLRKWEVYDSKYWQGGYEWGTATGPRGIRIGAPKLAVTFGAGPAELGELPPAANLAGQRGGAPTAVMPTPEQFKQYVEQFSFWKPEWMPDWQWQRVQELLALKGARPFPSSYDAYTKWLDEVTSWAPRRWAGFDAAERSQEYLLYKDAIPEPAKDHFKLYWWAWLMPDRDNKDLIQGYIGMKEAQAYYAKTKDWRGNFSVYRTYCRNMGTMNFNHWAAAGTLLGGAIMGSERCIAEGRHGLEAWPLRTWCWYDGSTQESIDHYYFSISLKDQKVFADFGPAQMDRMMGQSILAKSVEELVACYHPGLKRFIASSGRTGIAYVLVQQDGTKHIVHTLSRAGALTDLRNPKIVGGMSALGHDAEPGMIGQQALNGPWAPELYSYMVDEKPLPYEMTVNYKQWGNFNATPLWRKTYLGKHYGLASQDIVSNETVPVMAQWRRAEKPVENMQEVGTLLVRYGINHTELLDSLYHGTKQRNPNGGVGAQGGPTFTVQHRNKALVLASPAEDLDAGGGRPVPDPITSLQTTVGLFHFEEPATWEIYVDDEKVAAFPYKAKLTQRIAIKDGVSFVGLIPLPATDLGRDAEVELANDGIETEMQGGGKCKETLRIHAYNFRSEKPVARKSLEGKKTDLAYGGFYIELGDATEYKDFAAFREHFKQCKVDASWEDAKATLHLKVSSGKDLIEAGFCPGYKGGPTNQAFPYRRVNGQWAYLAEGIQRDSTLTQQGTSGRLEKNGATLVCDKGRMAYLVTEPVSGTYMGMNPFPDPTTWALNVPGGVTVQADGKVGLLKVVVRPKENKLWVDYAVRDEQKGAKEMATKLMLTGLANPTVIYNGRSAALQGGALPLTLEEPEPAKQAGVGAGAGGG